MTRQEVDLENSVWTLPASRSKNGREHQIPLTTPALAIIKAALEGADPQPEAPLFSRTGKPVQSNAVSKAVRRGLQICETPWTPHDIRRTVASGMASLGVFPHIVETVLNHVSGFRKGVAGVYNRHDYAQEKSASLNLWCDHLEALVEGRNSNVVPLLRRA